VIYSVIKYFAIYLLANEENIRLKYPFITREGIIASILFMISLFLLLLSNAPGELIAVYTIIIPLAILLYWYSLHTLIPSVLHYPKRRFLRYAWKVLQLLLVTAIPLGLLAFVIFYQSGPVGAIVLGNAAFQLVVTVPVAWFVYKYRIQNRSEIRSLKLALGNKDAHLDLLRAQINPHFLFNCLNAIAALAPRDPAARRGRGGARRQCRLFMRLFAADALTPDGWKRDVAIDVAAVVLKLGNVPVSFAQPLNAFAQLVQADVSGRFALGRFCNCEQP
jgi:hypothetical protein